MDTIAKGDAFEAKVFDIIAGELSGDRLGLSPSQAKIFRKKAYFSRDRKSSIIFDVAIEIWPPNAKNYSLLWVCECKDYGGTIPVNDVEEFKAKLDQIGGKNIKGVIASPNALQQGALNYAQSNGIGVVRILQDNQLSWSFHLMTTTDLKEKLNPREFAMALSNQDYVGRERSFYAIFEGYIFGSWYSLLSQSLKIV